MELGDRLKLVYCIEVGYIMLATANADTLAYFVRRKVLQCDRFMMLV